MKRLTFDKYCKSARMILKYHKFEIEPGYNRFILDSYVEIQLSHGRRWGSRRFVIFFNGRKIVNWEKSLIPYKVYNQTA